MTSSASPTGCSTAACACTATTDASRRFLAGYSGPPICRCAPQCRLLDDAPCSSDQLYDLGRQDLLVLFDYRRCQSQAQHVAQAAKARGTRLNAVHRHLRLAAAPNTPT